MNASMTNDYEHEIRHLREQIDELKVQNRILTDELSMAVKLKYHLMPNVYPNFPDVPDVNIFADSLQLKPLGGDYYDFFRIDADHIGIVVADIFDGGKAAALYMVAFKLFITSNTMMDDHIEDRMESVNDLLCMGNHNNLSLSAWFGVYEISTGVIRAVNAGHENALLLSDGRVWDYQEPVSYLLGVMPGMKFQSFEIKMEKGEKLLLYTDGVSAAQNPYREKYSRTRICRAFMETEGMSAEETIAHLQGDLQDFVKEKALHEDATFLCLERKGGER